MATTALTGWNALTDPEMPKDWAINVDVIREFFLKPADEKRLFNLIWDRAEMAAKQGRTLEIIYSPIYFASVWKTFGLVFQNIVEHKLGRTSKEIKREKPSHIIDILGKTLGIDPKLSYEVAQEFSAKLPDFDTHSQPGGRGQVVVEATCPNPLNPGFNISLLAFMVEGNQTAGQYYFGDNAGAGEETPEMQELARKLRGEPAPKTEGPVPARVRAHA